LERSGRVEIRLGCGLAALVGLASCAPSAEPPPIGATRSALEAPLQWVEREAIPPSVAADEGFGSVVAASGSVAVIGGTTSAYVFVQSANGWQRDATLISPGEGYRVSSAAIFGNEIALGVTSIAGGQTFLFTGSPGSWSEGRALLPRDTPGPGYGSALALGKDLLVVGSWELAVGVAYIFERKTGGFVEVQKLTGPRESAFADRLAVSGTTVLVSAPRENAPVGTGILRIYEKPEGVWRDIGSLGGGNAPGFGTDIAAGDNRLAATTGDGVLHVYSRLQNAWNTEAVIEPPPDSTRPPGAAVALSDSAAVVGLPLETHESQTGAGRAYVTFRSAAGWSTPTWLPSAGTGSGDNTGKDVALATDAALVGARLVKTGDPRGVVRTYGPCRHDHECAREDFCSKDGTCKSQKENGAACAGACREAGCHVCRSSHCIDGVCCEAPCDGECESCADPGREGRCVPVSEPPAARGKGCAESGGICGGSCNGIDPDCVYPAVGVPCASQCTGGVVTASQCNGRGVCVARSPRSCGGYVCGGDTCATECASDADCVAGFLCTDGVCAVGQRTTCSDDSTASQGPDGTALCFPYRCAAATGSCLLSCTSTHDCASEYLCDTAVRACVQDAPVPEEGCACRLAKPIGSRWWWLSISIAASAFVRRRIGRQRRRT
jgi:hypothetical protein